MQRRFFYYLFLFFCSVVEAKIPYQVSFEGLRDPAIIKKIKSSSELVSLKNRPPASLSALRYRAEGDVGEILKTLHYFGYHEAIVSFDIQESSGKTEVFVSIQTGPLYTIEDFIVNVITQEPLPGLQHKIRLEKIGIKIGSPAQNQQIASAEANVMRILAESGYPLAKIQEQKIIVNGDTKGVLVSLDILAGPVCHFGPTSIEGLTSVKPLYVEQKISWEPDSLYNVKEVEQTTEKLIESGLFGSVFITHGNTPLESGELPIKIDVTETKHKSLNIGASYQTYYGPGLTFGWENRNVSAMGKKLSIEGDVTKRSHTGIATYVSPNFWRIDQDYIWKAEALHESITAYTERSYSITNRLDRRVNKKVSFSVGAEVERLLVTSSPDNGNFVLVEFPMYVRWNSSNNLLNPTKGVSLEYRVIPSINLTGRDELYFWQQFVACTYLPVTKSQNFVIAQKLTYETVISPSLGAVPVPKRIFGGSDEDLRGYKYLTVSPLEHGKPIGGRSAIFYSFETRFRVTESFGIVPFFDLGKVNLSPGFEWNGKWFKSVGLGFRYFSFFAPIRFDVGVPLDRREGLDPKYRLVVSIGQSF